MTSRWAQSVAVAVGLIAGVCSSAVARAAGPDDFNYQRLQEGRMAFQQKRFGEAINQFRVAAFGSLDEPTLLTECLVRLALAQAAAGKTSDADETLARFVDLEKRFGSYARTSLEPDIRNDFQALLKKRVPPATLSGVPSLLVSEPASPGKGSSPSKAPAVASASAPAPAPAPASSRAPKASAPPPPTAAASGSAAASTKSSPKAPASAPTEPYLSTAERSHQAMVEGRRLINASRAGEAERLLSQALAADPGNRELRLSLLEASCLNRSYATSIAQVSAVSPFGEGESVSMFYAAVALYEVGRLSEARDLMKRADSRVSGPLVDEYAKKIMGQP
jgi:tetratricopeptide (TPR) repeat protein